MWTPRNVSIPSPLINGGNMKNDFQLFQCKCGKLWGAKNHLRKCNRCKTKVRARGNENEEYK